MLKHRIAASICLLAVALCAAEPALWLRSLPVCSVVLPGQEQFTRTIDCTGTVVSAELSVVSSEAPICVKKLYVQNGSAVKKGQKILDVDRERLLMLAAVAQSQNSASLDPQDAQAAIAAALAAQTSTAALPQALYAADDGIIEGLNVSAGGVLAAGAGVCSIVSGAAHRLRLIVPEDQLGQIPVGSGARFYPVAYSDREYYAVVENVPAVLRRQLTTTGYQSVADLWAAVDAGDDYLQDGMTVSATLTVSSPQELLTVPYEAIGQDARGEYVWTVARGRTVRTSVTTGVELECAVAVTAGLRSGVPVIADAQRISRAGQLVRLSARGEG